jgi:hypothetical protein
MAAATWAWIGSAAASPSPLTASSAPHQAAHSRPALGRWSSRTIKSQRLWSVSCPTSSFCMAVGQGPGAHYPQGYAYTYSHGKWSNGRRLDRYTYQDTVSCASSSFCVVFDSLPEISPAGYRGGYAFTYSRGRWSAGRKIAGSTSLTDVSCAAPSFCAATGLVEPAGGAVYIYSAGRWSHGRTLGRHQYPWVISCASRSFCLTVTTPWNGTAAHYATYAHGRWSRLHHVHTPGGTSLMSLSCPSARSCVAADDGGDAYIYSHGRWQPGHRIGAQDDSPSYRAPHGPSAPPWSATGPARCLTCDGQATRPSPQGPTSTRSRVRRARSAWRWARASIPRAGWPPGLMRDPVNRDDRRPPGR